MNQLSHVIYWLNTLADDMEVDESYNRPSYKLSQHSRFQSDQELKDQHRKRSLHLVEGEDSKEEVQMTQNEKQQNKMQREHEEENKDHNSNNNEEEKVSKDHSEMPLDRSNEDEMDSDKSDEISEQKSEECENSSNLKGQVLNLDCKYILSLSLILVNYI